MKSLIIELLWKAYYYFDYLNCLPHFSEVRQVDDTLCTEIFNKLHSINFDRSIVILATFNKSNQSQYINYLLSKLKDQPVIVVNNNSFGIYKSEIINENVIWVDRPNYLRDIGAYRLAISAICRFQNTRLGRVILMNDSFYVLREDFFQHISKTFEEDVVSHSFSEKPVPHFRSYWLSLKPTLLPALDRYLQKIPPTKSRYAAIKLGELGMSQYIFSNYICNVFPVIESVCEHNLFAYMAEIIKDNISSLENIKTIAINKLHYRNESLDPYEMKKASDYFIPSIIKREVYEKGLATREQCLFWIKSSEIPEHMRNEIAREVLINTRQQSLVNIFKRKIGEI